MRCALFSIAMASVIAGLPRSDAAPNARAEALAAAAAPAPAPDLSWPAAALAPEQAADAEPDVDAAPKSALEDISLAAAPAPPPGTKRDAAEPAPAPSASLPGVLAQYAEALGLSWRFYYAQRSGRLSEATANPVPWRSDSHLADPVVGGFHDAGDHLKLNFPLATTMAFLAWGLLEFPRAYAAAGAAPAALDNLRWGADYLMACHPDDDEYIAQIGTPEIDHQYWGRPEDDDQTERPAYRWGPDKPASDAAGAAASALAAISMAFKPSDPEYAAECLDHARRLFKFASQYEGLYSDSHANATQAYQSTSFLDDLAFAAAWLYKATQQDSYLAAARDYLKRAQFERVYWVSWDSVYAAADLLLLSEGAEPTEGVDSDWQVDTFQAAWMGGLEGIRYSPRGLAVAPLEGWGNLRYAANAAFMLALRAKQTPDLGLRATFLAWARGQLDYMLGLPFHAPTWDMLGLSANVTQGSERSYMVGFGANPPRRVHHAGASCPDPPAPCDLDEYESGAPNPQVLAGALVGGPDEQDAYEDTRADYKSNEVALDYNGGLTGALAGLIELLPTVASYLPLGEWE